jgi:hypothetical protein
MQVVFPFSELPIRVRLKFEVLLFTLRKSQKHNFPRRTSGLAEIIANFTGSKIYLLPKIFFHENPFLKVGFVLN